MTEQRVSRRRLLGAVSALGIGSVAGCLGVLSGEPGYVCTAIDDESTVQVGEDETPIPFSFERPSVMDQTDANPTDGFDGGIVTFERKWTQSSDRRNSPIRNEIRLRLRYSRGGDRKGPRYLRDDGTTVSVMDKRTYEGETIGVLELESNNRESSLSLLLPTTRDGERAYDEFALKAEANLGGYEDDVNRALGEDGDQTCGGALRSVTRNVLSSVSGLSPAETETTLSLSPSSTSVRRGEEVEFTVQASGVDWVDLTIGNTTMDGYSFLGAFSVGEDPVPITVSPPTEGNNSEVVTVPDDVTVNVVNSVGDFTPTSYPVQVAAPGNDGLVTKSATLSVEAP